MSLAPTSASRQAALTLHAMCVEDRAWVLQALPDTQRLALEALLDELRELGIPAQPRLLDSVLMRQPGRVAQPSDSLQNLNATGIEALATLLRGEPGMLVARLLRMQAWPWQAAVLTRLGGVQRQQVQDALRQLDSGSATPVPAALQAAMLHGIHHRMPSAGVQP